MNNNAKEKSYRAVTIRMESALADRLDAFCEASGQSKTFAMTKALASYIDNYDSQQALLAKLGDNHTTIQP